MVLWRVTLNDFIFYQRNTDYRQEIGHAAESLFRTFYNARLVAGQ